MNQQQIRHATGTFAACADCRMEPKHFIATGKSSREPVTFKPVPERHQLECRCGRSTGWRENLASATSAWGEMGATFPLPLVVPTEKVTPMRQRRGRDKA